MRPKEIISGIFTHSSVFSALVLVGLDPGAYFLRETNIRVLSPTMPSADAHGDVVSYSDRLGTTISRDQKNTYLRICDGFLRVECSRFGGISSGESIFLIEFISCAYAGNIIPLGLMGDLNARPRS